MTTNEIVATLNVSPEPKESILDIINELPELDPVSIHPAQQKGFTKKSIAIFMICYGIAILLLSFNISTNANLFAVHQDKEDSQRNNNKNITTCLVDELSNTITLNCGTREKVFSLGKQFDFGLCN